MWTHSADYEPFAWWLARERIGADLRAYYTTSQDLPSEIRALAERLGDTVEGDQFREESSSPSALSLLSKLDAVEGSQLLRVCRKHLRALSSLQQSGSSA
jgi:hypothetical protein